MKVVSVYVCMCIRYLHMRTEHFFSFGDSLEILKANLRFYAHSRSCAAPIKLHRMSAIADETIR
jgi:hypothetical protein